MGTQKDRLKETVLLSTQKICQNLRVRNIRNFMLKNVFILTYEYNILFLNSFSLEHLIDNGTMTCEGLILPIHTVHGRQSEVPSHFSIKNILILFHYENIFLQKRLQIKTLGNIYNR